MTDPVAIGVGAAVCCTFLAVASLAVRHRDQPGALPFVALTLSLATMAVPLALGRASILSTGRTELGVFVPLAFALLAWLALAFEYTGRGPVMTARRSAVLAGFGVAVLGITVLGFVVPVSFLPAWLFLVNVSQMALVAAAGYGAFLVARSAIGYDDVPLGGSLVLATAGGGIIAVTVVLILVPYVSYETGFSALQALLAGVAFLLLLAQVRYRAFETGPSTGHLAREIVLDELSAAAAITNRENRLLDCNRTAERTFGLEGPAALGEPIGDVLGIDPDRRTETPVSIETKEGRRRFEVDRIELLGRGGDPIGRAYLLRDVTDRLTLEQQLDVLDRVLRHNLRNDLDAIRGFAEALERSEDGIDPETIAERIHATASDLADLGETISLAERTLAREDLEHEPVDVAGLARRVASDLGDTRAAASVSVSTDDPDLACTTDRRILETVLEETVENAVEHNDAADPRVDLAVRPTDSGTEIAVRDNGPGIPQRERAVLLEGEENPLRHGSGLGLWLVSWGVTRLGGDLEFRANDPRGSVVSIRIPNR